MCLQLSLPLAPSVAKGCLHEALWGESEGQEGRSAGCCCLSPLLGRLVGVHQLLGTRPWPSPGTESLVTSFRAEPSGPGWQGGATWAGVQGVPGHAGVAVTPSPRTAMPGGPSRPGRWCLNLPRGRPEPGTVPRSERLSSILLDEGGVWAGTLTMGGWTRRPLFGTGDTSGHSSYKSSSMPPWTQLSVCS